MINIKWNIWLKLYNSTIINLYYVIIRLLFVFRKLFPLSTVSFPLPIIVCDVIMSDYYSFPLQWFLSLTYFRFFSFFDKVPSFLLWPSTRCGTIKAIHHRTTITSYYVIIVSNQSLPVINKSALSGRTIDIMRFLTYGKSPQPSLPANILAFNRMYICNW